MKSLKDKSQSKIMQYYRRYMAKNPWAKHYNAVEGRCSTRTAKYYKKGIKNFMKTADFKYLWFRDKAWLLKRPSIDRIDPKGHYTLENCRFIELSLNASIGAKENQSRKIKQLTLDGKLVKVWNSAKEASLAFGKNACEMAMCARGLVRKVCGFKWEYCDGLTKTRRYSLAEATMKARVKI